MAPAFKVGDRVRVPLGQGRASGVITRDRGAIGWRGRRLYEVLLSMDPFEPAPYELPEDEIEPIGDEVESKSDLDRAKVKSYLAHGGLISILNANLAGGPNQPRAWLRPDTLGNVTHTFEEARGLLGGKTIPSMAVHEGKVFATRREEVLAFLEGFDLDRADADRILSRVGTMP